ncbi:MAG: hypothetical protein FWD71_22950 [Oscillospiraceae bacterium]|nr:hypothetical protein [Oscillospiraceae bacterium]
MGIYANINNITKQLAEKGVLVSDDDKYTGRVGNLKLRFIKIILNKQQ